MITEETDKPSRAKEENPEATEGITQPTEEPPEVTALITEETDKPSRAKEGTPEAKERIIETKEETPEATEETPEPTETPLPYEGKYTRRKQKRRRASYLRRFFNEEL
ncbi:hypothetical protein [Lysinibacillus xylanilyticus]|uniref:hypothetical protein n=1 Tax=Lysinibacillus xylanilyticus TaxID=582475 RepID=UPI0036DC1EFA